ncbi:hypothetical protein J5N97_027912 [Dioscorea zingiberensis]|uniref:Uncharacterized protein n=1 Tax=Dioscorea zingiberensis TaxID=325984 RepID=A0A9D5H475_9LILI|nr:hypothetical protein J5N97_027912 [Dioscorea zingiberensis]
MGAITTQVYKSLESYWRHRTYKRIEDSSEKKKREIRLGEGGKERRGYRKIKTVKMVFRIQVRIFTPARLFTKLRDAYVNSLMAFAGEKKRLPASVEKKKKRNGELGQAIPKALRNGSVRGDFEKRMMIHIYNSLVAPREFENSSVSVRDL